MISVSISLEDDLAMMALAQARSEGLDIGEFVISAVRKALDGASASQGHASASPEHWLDEAVQRAKRVAHAAEFKLQDLFSKDEWKNIPSPTVFGREFRKTAEQQGLATHVGKTPANQAIYKRK
ncbi:DUF1413 domain-containing protein [Variovorax sp. J22R115]|uniref:DUF1413 domain-containing protein n=1 Tax=Variovorax sp. J22R115 TaxID=3053509 RepID=UPI002577E873|nr:DUF1413 domain-containing protein [Variovorax sp. J22R115]MDM0052017.1 DUF1413 domain-containing protein [Variovorax sp. J22R115]